MAGYLDQYGAGEERREKIIKRTALAVVVLLAAGGVLYLLFKNYREERQAREFFELLQKHDYQGAYRMWGCTEAKPCRDYPLAAFMKDWGPQSERADVSAYKIAKSRSCGSGVILTVDFGKSQEEKLWVQREDLTLGFSPWPGCPPGR
jgi:hypothetical protein